MPSPVRNLLFARYLWRHSWDSIDLEMNTPHSRPPMLGSYIRYGLHIDVPVSMRASCLPDTGICRWPDHIETCLDRIPDGCRAAEKTPPDCSPALGRSNQRHARPWLRCWRS